MGNTHAKPHPRPRNKKQVHWKAADRPSPPGKPRLSSDSDLTPDLVTIVWLKPIRDGGSPITGYLVEHRRTGSPHWVRAAPVLSPIPELTLSGLEPGWRYQFRVRAENAVGLSDPSEISEPLTVTLQKFAITAPKFTEELKDVTVLENDKVEFIVHFLGQPPPKVCWFKDGFEIFSSRRTRIFTENDKSILTIHQSALSDEGEIKCTATNKAGHASTKARLSLEAPPSIRLPRQYEDGLLFEIGEVLRLKVSVAGRPTPLVFWSHDGETIQNNDRYEIEYVDKCSILKVGEASRTDRGEYQIKAVNKIGEDITSFLVTITDKPSPPGKARVVMTLGRSVTLSWSIPDDDGGCKIGNYIIEYYRLGWNVWLKAATSRQLTTILGDLIEGSEYKFRVKAESPYGVSEPSEESDIVFIPDPKRGITSPQARSRSQPKDIIDEIAAPIAARRKKTQPRSQSSTAKVEAFTTMCDETPKRPDRNRIKSPPKTPDLSPKATRKEFSQQTLIDRASLARELAYGSPEIKVKKTEVDLPKSNYIRTSPPERPPPAPAVVKSLSPPPALKPKSPSPSPQPKTPSPSPSPQPKTPSPSLSPQPRTPSPSPSPYPRTPSPISPPPPKSPSPSPAPVAKTPSPKSSLVNEDKNKTPSPKDKRSFLREKSETFEESSEFMLVLYPDRQEKGSGQRRSSQNIAFDFDEFDIPPPISLSAPELGVEPPIFENLKPSASSTELLHERAMMRFNEAAAAEEEELRKRRKFSYDGQHTIEIPKIQINSKDDTDIVGLERKPSRRRSSGSVVQQQLLWAQKRFSLKNSGDLTEMVENKRQKSPKPNTSPDSTKKEMVRQRSESEEREEEEFEKVRTKMALKGQSSFEKRSIEVVDEDKWMEDYEESLSESETESSEDERNYEEKPPPRAYSDEDEDTYHPGFMTGPRQLSAKDEPFEILTKRNKLPDPNFVPKPILKRTEEKVEPVIKETPKEVVKETPKEILKETASAKTRSHSPRPQFRQPQDITRERSQSLAQPTLGPGVSNKIFQRSFSVSETEKANIPQNLMPSSNIAPGQNISAVATLCGITAASIVIPQELLRKKTDEEEAKVVVDHYMDIVRNYGQRKRSNPQIITNWKTIDEPKSTQRSWDALEDTEDKEDTTPLNKTMEEPKPVQQPWKAPEEIPKPVQTPWRSSDIKEQVPLRPMQPTWLNLQEKEPSPPPVKQEPLQISNTIKPYKPETVQKRSDRSPSRSPSPHRVLPSQQRGRSMQEGRRRISTRSKTPTKSPSRLENWSGRSQRKSSPSPMKVKTTTRRTPSPSPIPLAKPKPKLKEIMTQTSIGLELNYSSDSRTSTPNDKRQEELLAKAEFKVKSFVDYLTDLAMFAVACWLYLFSNELLAIPVLLVMVYRQLKNEIGKRIPKWIVRRFNKTKTTKK
ncbi:hypothetical protein Zmor_005268 [Zophobas morio]|uniref:Titin n=1 Tax=Zophobas morio TaxID=2755281 RepID=A0AA38IVM6_9CUCU|nr:hypothetical protein Zmor_005268 [Zophobas morio]